MSEDEGLDLEWLPVLYRATGTWTFSWPQEWEPRDLTYQTLLPEGTSA